MILNGSAQVLLNLKKKTITENLSKCAKKKLGVLNVIKQLQHFILCNYCMIRFMYEFPGTHMINTGYGLFSASLMLMANQFSIKL